MGCWHGHGYGHGCGPGYYVPAPRGYHGPVDEYDWYEDVSWPLRHRDRERAGERESRGASLEMRLEELREEVRRLEAALADLPPSARRGTAE